MLKKISFITLFVTIWMVSFTSYATPTTNKVEQFINNMVKKYHFNKKKLTNIFQQAQYNAKIIAKIMKPYENKPWYEYRSFFITQNRINNGLKFWKKYETALHQAQKNYGIPPNIILGILGIETNYGDNLGKYNVLNSLFTLAFHYPSREHFFKYQLTQYLILCREAHLNPLMIKGSYAGAIGLPQFMPSSYRNYAVDATGNGKIDLSNNVNDAIASIANFLKKSGWKSNQPIAIEAKVTTQKNLPNTPNDFKPLKTIMTLEKIGIQPTIHLSKHEKGMLIALQDKNKKEYWIGLHNFYVISRYNPRVNYVMAVLLLSKALERKQLKNNIAPIPS